MLKTDKQYLFIPGPTPIPPAVTMAMTKPVIGHRTSEFSELYRRVVQKMQTVYQTKNDLFILSNSGTGALEMAVANTINPGDKVLSLVTGVFAERFARIAAAFGGQVDKMEFPWEGSIDLEAVGMRLQEKDYKVVLVTHNETSTGVVNDITGLGELVKKTGALLLVDAVSSLGGIDVRTDIDHLDIVVTSSQKALMLPPGLAAISVSAKAWKRINECRNSRLFFSLAEYEKAMRKGSTPWTPAVTMIYGLEAALDMILAEGLPQVFARHRLLSQAVRAGIKAIGLQPLAVDNCASPTVTAVWAPDNINPDKLRLTLEKEMGAVFAGGASKLAGKILRFAHMGYAGSFDVLTGLAALEMGLACFNYPISLGKGIKAAQEVLLAGNA